MSKIWIELKLEVVTIDMCFPIMLSWDKLLSFNDCVRGIVIYKYTKGLENYYELILCFLFCVCLFCFLASSRMMPYFFLLL